MFRFFFVEDASRLRMAEGQRAGIKTLGLFPRGPTTELEAGAVRTATFAFQQPTGGTCGVVEIDGSLSHARAIRLAVDLGRAHGEGSRGSRREPRLHRPACTARSATACIDGARRGFGETARATRASSAPDGERPGLDRVQARPRLSARRHARAPTKLARAAEVIGRAAGRRETSSRGHRQTRPSRNRHGASRSRESRTGRVRTAGSPPW